MDIQGLSVAPQAGGLKLRVAANPTAQLRFHRTSRITLRDHTTEELERLLERYEGLEHLRVKRRGDSLTIQSGDATDPHLHARLSHLGDDHWGLSLPRHTGRWERTPFIGTMEDIVTTLATDLGFHLADVAADERGNPGRG